MKLSTAWSVSSTPESQERRRERPLMMDSLRWMAWEK